jgi:hypothetical protein
MKVDIPERLIQRLRNITNHLGIARTNYDPMVIAFLEGSIAEFEEKFIKKRRKDNDTHI